MSDAGPKLLYLYEAPKGCRIYCHTSDGSRWLTFHHIDDSYSLCTTEKGQPCHLDASTLLRQRAENVYDVVDLHEGVE